MSEAPEGILSTESHEYILIEENLAKIGITDYAVHQLGDVVFVDLPEVGVTFAKGEIFGTIESVKAASELYMPIGGEVAQVNDDLLNEPELINNDPYGKGWIIKLKNYNSDDLSEAMNYVEYKKYIEE